MQRWKRQLLCWFWILTPVLLRGESAPPFTIDISPASVPVGEAAELQLSVEGDLTREIEIPTIPNVRRTGSGTSSNISITNGHVSRQVTYSYSLEPQEAGVVNIPSFSIEIDGKTYSTRPLTLTVTAAGSAAAVPSQQEDNNKTNNGGSATEARTPALFIRREFSTTTPYETQPVVMTVKIYHRVDLAKAEVIGEKATAVRVLPLGEDRGQETINGEVYQVIRLREVWMPQKAGAIAVPPFRLQAGMVVASKRSPRSMDDIFSGFFNQGRVVNKVVEAAASTLTVRPIPKDPRDHLGLVGSFMGSASLSAHEVKVGETSTLTLQIQGKGTLDRLGKVSLSFPSGLRAYEDKPESKEEPSAEKGLMSRGIFKFALVASQAGTFSLGTYRLAFFDPTLEKFSEIIVPLGTLTVEGGAEAPAVAASGGGTVTPVALPAAVDDVVDLYRGEWKEAPVLCQRHVSCLVAGIPFLIYLVCCLWMYLRRRGASELRRSRSQAWKKFEAMVGSTARMDPVQGAQVLYGELRNYLGVLAGCKGAALTRQELDALFASRGIQKDLCERVQRMAARLETSAYSAQALSPEEAKDMMTQLVVLAKEVDKKW